MDLTRQRLRKGHKGGTVRETLFDKIMFGFLQSQVVGLCIVLVIAEVWFIVSLFR